MWIPLKPAEDIEDFQHMLEAKHDVILEETEVDEDFVRASALPEATMLKQEKTQQTQSVHNTVLNPVPVSFVYSSS